MDRVRIFDTTLRDGEQSPGVSLNRSQKLAIAKQLDRLGVDICEIGFPACSPDLEAVLNIVDELVDSDMRLSVLARCKASDIELGWDVVKHSKHPRLHLFYPGSDIMLEVCFILFVSFSGFFHINLMALFCPL